MHPSEKQSELITHLFTLFIRCPFGQAARDCPFADIRALQSLELKFQLAEKMAMHPQCHKNVHEAHGTCYRERIRTIMRRGKPPKLERYAMRTECPPQTATNRL